jgi:hypothetical protein
MVMSSNYLEDGQGNASSKRLFGAILIGIGGLMGVALFTASLFIVVKDPATAISTMNTFIFTGSGLLGIGVLEGVVKK